MGGPTPTPPPTASVTSVRVSCSPASILITQTSTCTSTVTGTGSYSSSVIWSVVPSNIGTVSSAGVFTPAAAGTATITATSIQDSTKSGTGSIAAANTAALAIAITDLPTGTLGAVTLTDPNGQQTQVTASEIMAAIPGTYTVTATPVPVNSSTYYAKQPDQTVQVTAENPTPVSIDYYDVIPQTTKVLDSVGVQSLQISSDGFTWTISSASAVAQSLQAGNVLVVPPTAADGVAPEGLMRKVTAVNVGASTIAVTVQAATLADAFQRLSININTTPNVPGSQIVRAVHTAPGVVFHPGARLQPHPLAQALSTSSTIQDPCPYPLGVFDKSASISLDPVPGITLDGQVELCAGFNFSVDIIGVGWSLQPQLNSLTATSTIGEYSDLTLQGNYTLGSFEYGPETLATLDLPPIPVPGLPVWVTPEVTLFVGANGAITTGFSTEVSEAGTVIGGVTYASGQWTPVQANSVQFGFLPPTLDASLQAKAYAGVGLNLMVWDLVGPSFKPDGYLDFSADITANPWWTLTGGVEGPMSLDVTFLGYNLANYELGSMFDYSTVIKQASGPFLPTAAGPSIQMLTPSQVSAGSPGFNLGVIGSNFVPGAVVNFGSTALTANWQNSGSLTVAVPATAVAQAGTIAVTVANPGTGAGTSAAVNFTVTKPTITVTVAPTTAQVPAKDSQQFAATVANTSNTAVSWSVNGFSGGSSTVGTINASGLYTAPTTVPNPATVTVTAKSQADPTISGSAPVTIGPYTSKTLYSFTSLSDGAAPSAPLIQGSDGNYYGTTQEGGTNGYGTVFKVDASGNITTLHEFDDTDGVGSITPLIQANDGNFYGTSEWGGEYGEGTVFKMDSSGSLSTLYSFTGGNDGGDISGGVIQAKDGYLYGIAFGGGTYNSGTVYRMDLSGNISTLYSFTGGSDGNGPIAGLVQGTNGLFYGVTETGGNPSCEIWTQNGSGCGTVFSIDSAGNFNTLYSFSGGTDGANPDTPLLQASDGEFYGTTNFGGDPSCTVSTYTGCGSIFRIDSSGNFTYLYDFTGGTEGGVPFSSLIQAGDGDFYGTTAAGGDTSCSVVASGENYATYIGCGTVFKMDQAGNVSVLYSFQGSPSDGSNPFASVLEGSDGYLYGTTRWGGTATSCPYTSNGGCGTFFRVTGPGGPLPLPSLLRPTTPFPSKHATISPPAIRSTTPQTLSAPQPHRQPDGASIKGSRRRD